MEENIDTGGFPNLSILDSSLNRLEGKVGGRGMEAPDRFSRSGNRESLFPLPGGTHGSFPALEFSFAQLLEKLEK